MAHATGFSFSALEVSVWSVDGEACRSGRRRCPRQARGSSRRAQLRHVPPRRSAPAARRAHLGKRAELGDRTVTGCGGQGLEDSHGAQGRVLQGWRPRRRTAWLLPAETQVLLRPGSSSGQRPSLRLEPLRPSSRLSRPAPSAPLRAPPVSPAHFPAPRLGNSSRLAGRLGRPPPHWPRSFGWRARDWWTSAFLPGAARDWLAEAQSAEPGRCRRGLRRRLLRGGGDGGGGGAWQVSCSRGSGRGSGRSGAGARASLVAGAGGGGLRSPLGPPTAAALQPRCPRAASQPGIAAPAPQSPPPQPAPPQSAGPRRPLPHPVLLERPLPNPACPRQLPSPHHGASSPARRPPPASTRRGPGTSHPTPAARLALPGLGALPGGRACRPLPAEAADVGRGQLGAGSCARSSVHYPFPRSALPARKRERFGSVFVHFAGRFRVPLSLETRDGWVVLGNFLFIWFDNSLSFRNLLPLSSFVFLFDFLDSSAL